MKTSKKKTGIQIVGTRDITYASKYGVGYKTTLWSEPKMGEYDNVIKAEDFVAELRAEAEKKTDVNKNDVALKKYRGKLLNIFMDGYLLNAVISGHNSLYGTYKIYADELEAMCERHTVMICWNE